MRPITFRGRTGFALWAALILIAAVTFGLAFVMDDIGRWIFIILGIVLILSVLPFFVRNSVELTADSVRICFGYTTQEIPLDSVISIRKATSAVAAGAGSAKRLEISYLRGKRTDIVQFSVRDEDLFIKELCGLNGNVKVL